MKDLHAIAAMSLNRVIGNRNRLPWRISEDLAWFRAKTWGHTVVVGRKTFESIGNCPLPGRRNVVISSKKIDCPPTTVIASAEEALSLPGKVWICGGATVYGQLLPFCEDLFLTLVKREIGGDAFFPEFEKHFRLDQIVADNPIFAVQRWVHA
jgi:dihydrofolate reductase